MSHDRRHQRARPLVHIARHHAKDKATGHSWWFKVIMHQGKYHRRYERRSKPSPFLPQHIKAQSSKHDFFGDRPQDHHYCQLFCKIPHQPSRTDQRTGKALITIPSQPVKHPYPRRLDDQHRKRCHHPQGYRIFPSITISLWPKRSKCEILPPRPFTIITIASAT